MPTSPTEAELLAGARLRFVGDGAELIVPEAAPREVLAVPGTAVAIHWLELTGDLTGPQAAAAARLMLADASAEPIAQMHVAAGRPEQGLTPIALVPRMLMEGWLADGADPDLVIPTSLLLLPPAEGLVRRGLDHRGLAQAFSVEPELADLLTGGAAVTEIDDSVFEGGLAAALAAPVLNLRQGPFARRRQWQVDPGARRRIVMLVAALLVVSLVLQLATIMRYSFAADRLAEEAARLAPRAGAPVRPDFDRLAPALFEAVRATPNAQLTRLDYRPDGSLAATVQVDSAATLAALRARAEAGGAITEGGSIATIAGQQSADIVLRPA
jgi:general secretion pathway protein L